MYIFASTIITGVFSMVFSKNVASPTVPVKAEKSFYDLLVNDINGIPIDFSKMRGKKIMVVNVASRCGYTSQYKDLQKIYNEYSKALEIIAIPCNDFGSQEPGSESQIKDFCQTNYGITFTLASKQRIKSSPISDLYNWLSDPSLNGWNSSLPSWNFCKYIIDEDGNLTHFLKSGVSPSGAEMREIFGT